MKLLEEFKKFAIKGNVVDLATAVIIGGAFGKIVSSLVADIVMPLVGLFTGGNSFSAWKIILRPAELAADGSIIRAALSLNAGIFVQNIIDFLIISFSVFIMIKVLLKVKDKFRKAEPEEKEATPAPKEPNEEIKLLQEIRDALVKDK
ncbi:MAG: large-conductance mechanosensitive channel protein MscL [Patescibacteria group bacterium]|nr:large-conductance mechanosensitive channel protein MscL [Patescibacteria group bacterium]